MNASRPWVRIQEMKIKISSGYTGPGGSTVAFINLVNLFNENGVDAILYGNSDWAKDQCKFENSEYLHLTGKDSFITHYLQPSMGRPKVRNFILSCHETKLYPLKQICNDTKIWDKIHFVSQFQKDWQGVDGVVIPNPLKKLESKFSIHYHTSNAGIIGTIDRNKRTHLSIQKALDDGRSVQLWGKITDWDYFNTDVLKLMGDGRVKYCGVSKNMQEVYAQLKYVYHSPELETYNMVKPECEAAGVTYVGNEGNDTKAEVWDNKRIFEAWMTLLQ